MTTPWEWRGGAACARVWVGQGHYSHFLEPKTVSTLRRPQLTWRPRSALSVLLFLFFLAVILPVYPRVCARIYTSVYVVVYEIGVLLYF